ncbi:NifB/NifX family molybdenum-iron cluster-binding protein [Desulfobacula sp.]|uniref:NifB/NifX family molybdenum-iron cluster-binding protein n=1 Tax=Desulfobacula sp. TaxID=2593537 RepID=UPI00262AFB23|nr:NifB/NifX family molybdenum-iron cluster-binding protein [Desulfobacula sp.]
MKVCFPVASDNGLKSEIFGHFGSAPFFVVFNTQEKALATIDNQDLGHIHGQCNPMKALNNKMVDAIIVGGIGAGAITGLNKMGIKVYKASKGNIQDNIQLFEAGSLMEMTMAHTCGGHVGGCAH